MLWESAVARSKRILAASALMMLKANFVEFISQDIIEKLA
tara:strand:- start:307 stop:426 length:120 start_codon:yes stop_codon:yes gene_type:complete